jgi:hypothetical protein
MEVSKRTVGPVGTAGGSSWTVVLGASGRAEPDWAPDWVPDWAAEGRQKAAETKAREQRRFLVLEIGDIIPLQGYSEAAGGAKSWGWRA